MIEILTKNNSLSSLESKDSQADQIVSKKIYSAEEEQKLFDRIVRKTVMHYPYSPIITQCDLLFKSSHEQRDF